MKSIFLALAFVCFMIGSASLAGSFTAELDKQQTVIDEPIWLTISIQGSLDDGLKVPDSQDFEFSKTGESTNISIVNGSITKELQYTYQVRPLREGALSIPSFVAKIDGRLEKTLPIQVVVSATGQQSNSSKKKQDFKKLVFVERDLNKAELYEGQAARSTGRLLTRTRLTGATPVREPSPNWRVIPVDGQRNRDMTRDGVRYNAVEMDEVLIPLKAGKLLVPQFGINASWIQDVKRPERRRPSSVFDLFQQGMFNLGEEVSRKLVSEAIYVDVKPLPAPKPADFSDIVGAFSLKSAVSSREIVAGETLTVTIDLSGQGALDRMQELKLTLVGARVYDDKPELVEKVEPAAGLVSTKRFRFAVVPQHAGALNLGIINLTAFNPFTESYEKLSVNLETVSVKWASSSADSGQVPINKESANTEGPPAKVVSNDISLAPKPVVGKLDSDTPWWLSPWILASEFLAVSLVLAWLLVRKFFSFGSIVKFREPAIIRGGESLRDDLRKGDINVILNVLARFRDVLSTRVGESKAMTSLDLLMLAKNNNVNKPVLESLARVLAASDRLQYGAGDGISISDQMTEDVNVLIDYCLSKDIDERG